jgi:hypothetical protein
MIIRADFTAGGLSKKSQCVYFLTIRGFKKIGIALDEQAHQIKPE